MSENEVDIEQLRKEIDWYKGHHMTPIIEVLRKEIELLRTYIHQELADWCEMEAKKHHDPT